MDLVRIYQKVNGCYPWLVKKYLGNKFGCMIVIQNYVIFSDFHWQLGPTANFIVNDCKIQNERTVKHIYIKVTLNNKLLLNRSSSVYCKSM